MSIKTVSIPINNTSDNEENIIDCKGARMEMDKESLKILIPTSGLEDSMNPISVNGNLKYLRISIPRSDVKKVIQDLYMS